MESLGLAIGVLGQAAAAQICADQTVTFIFRFATQWRGLRFGLIQMDDSLPAIVPAP